MSRNDANPTGAATTAVRNSAADLNQANLAVTVNSAWQAGTDVTVTATYPWSVSLLGWVVVGGHAQVQDDGASRVNAYDASGRPRP